MSVTDGLASPNTVHPVCLDLVKSETSNTDTVPGVEQRLTHTHVVNVGELDEGMATHPSTLAWKISWTEEPGGLQSRSHKESDTDERAHTHPHTPHCLIHCLNSWWLRR